MSTNIKEMRATWARAKQAGPRLDPQTIDTIRQYTNRNLHTESLILVAEIFGMDRLAEQYRLIQKLAGTFGHTPSELMDLRYRISKPLYDRARKTPLPTGETLVDLL